ncbi:MAG TPA: hypothetical protein VNR38_06225 [Ureibacillus sp.]|nr:hypothetical protein [Ureibacillus sp.]
MEQTMINIDKPALEKKRDNSNFSALPLFVFGISGLVSLVYLPNLETFAAIIFFLAIERKEKKLGFLLLYFGSYFISLLMVYRFQTEYLEVWTVHVFLPILIAILILANRISIQSFILRMKEKYLLLSWKHNSLKVAIVLIIINGLLIYYPHFNELFAILLILTVCYVLLNIPSFLITTTLFLIYYWGVYHFLLYKELDAATVDLTYYLQFQLLQTINPLIFGLFLVFIFRPYKEKNLS